MIALLKHRIYRAVVDSEIRCYKQNIAALEKRMAEDQELLKIGRGYLALSLAEAQSDRYLGTEISDQDYRSSVWQALVWAYLALGAVGGAICWFV
jgi:hypothetical protein